MRKNAIENVIIEYPGVQPSCVCCENHPDVVGDFEWGITVSQILLSFAERRLSVERSCALKNPFLVLVKQHCDGIRESHFSSLREVS